MAPTLHEIRDAAVAAENWPLAAQALLAMPTSTKLSRETVSKLAGVAGLTSDMPNNPAYLIRWVSEAMDTIDGVKR